MSSALTPPYMRRKLQFYSERTALIVLKHAVAVAVAYEPCEKLAIAQLVLYQPGMKQKIGCNISIVMKRLPAPALQHNLSISAGVRAAAADVDDGEEAAM